MTQQLAMGPIMLDIEGTTLSQDDKYRIHHPNTGAVILFSRNFESPEQISELINEIRGARNGHLLIAVDQEGGRVQRFQNGFTRLPPAQSYRDHPDMIEQSGWLMAMELLSVGVDFSFAPVLDVDCGISEIIGDRSFSGDCHLAADYASLFSQGMRRAGMASTGKHFPGHGAVAVDSHVALPVDERDLKTIRNKDLVPFKRLINEGLEAVMPAHIIYPEVDNKPAGFSRTWLQQILRTELKFDGTIFSDDLSMEGAAIAGNYPQRALLAQQAGCDMILVCNNPDAADQVLNNLPVTDHPERTRRLKRMQGKTHISRSDLLASAQWLQVSERLSQWLRKS